jgi:hypothetical protein
MLQVDFNILNQKGTPAFFADALANRPSAGFAGRIFVDTDNPSTGMYRDTGTIWVSVASVGTGGSQNLQSVCTIGNTTTTNMAVGIAPTGGSFYTLDASSQDFYTTYGNSVLSTFFSRKIQTFNALTAFINGPAHTSISGIANYTLNTNQLIPSGVSAFGGLYVSTAYQLNGNQLLVAQAGSGRSVSDIRTQTVVDASGSVGGQIQYSSGIYIGQIYQPAGALVTINNRYGLFIQDQGEVFIGTLVSRFGIYQAGTNDGNYLAGYTAIGNQIFVAGVKLNVEGGSIRGVGAGSTSATNGLQILNNGGTTTFVALDNGNCGIRVAAPTARMHIATGGATTASLGLKVRNSADTLDILSTFGTGQVIVNSTSGSLEVSAQFQIDSTTRGALVPRMTEAQILLIATPANGLLVFNTTQNVMCCYQAGSWVKFSHSPM